VRPFSSYLFQDEANNHFRNNEFSNNFSLRSPASSLSTSKFNSGVWNDPPLMANKGTEIQNLLNAFETKNASRHVTLRKTNGSFSFDRVEELIGKMKVSPFHCCR